ncbi:lactosylceramide 4-alpha-galactosyltransferase-like [Eriocheir sinensis]|uniref:lactosylceramide 4-alpha-galactosyltransferase-like n=1 Tax=Eriocheir sinensis TaxID=95602 RepID=UPI0021C5A281|nr:lactosylceramide 4-alpha-galactosyltransferase-like [Eriocheir sinensis]
MRLCGTVKPLRHPRGKELMRLHMRTTLLKLLSLLLLMLVVTITLQMKKQKATLRESNQISPARHPPHADDVNNDTWWRRLLCRNVHYTKDAVILPFLNRDVKPSKDRLNVFLTEMSCSPRPLYRSWCALESWALQNRRASVWLVMLGKAVDPSDGLLLALSEAYPNLRLVTMDLDWLFSSLPTHRLFSSGQWAGSTWPGKSLSNMVRLALVWRFGGFYTDFDTVCLRDVQGLSNVVGSQSSEIVNNAVFHFEHHHPFVQDNMEQQNKNFDGASFNVNGVNIMSEAAKTACNTSDFEDLVRKREGLCRGFRVLPESAFYPVAWDSWRDIFRPGAGPNLLKRLNGSYVLHAWNVFSALSPIRIGMGTLYDLVSSAYCPVTKRHLLEAGRVWGPF